MPFDCNFGRVLSGVGHAREVPYRGEMTPVPGTLGTVPYLKYTRWLRGVTGVRKVFFRFSSALLLPPNIPNLLKTDVD